MSESRHCSPLPKLQCFAQHHFSTLLHCNQGLLSTVIVASLVLSAASITPARKVSLLCYGTFIISTRGLRSSSEGSPVWCPEAGRLLALRCLQVCKTLQVGQPFAGTFACSMLRHYKSCVSQGERRRLQALASLQV